MLFRDFADLIRSSPVRLMDSLHNRNILSFTVSQSIARWLWIVQIATLSLNGNTLSLFLMPPEANFRIGFKSQHSLFKMTHFLLASPSVGELGGLTLEITTLSLEDNILSKDDILSSPPLRSKDK